MRERPRIHPPQHHLAATVSHLHSHIDAVAHALCDNAELLELFQHVRQVGDGFGRVAQLQLYMDFGDAPQAIDAGHGGRDFGPNLAGVFLELADGKHQAGGQAVRHGRGEQAAGVGAFAVAQRFGFVGDDVAEVTEIDLEHVVFQQFEFDAEGFFIRHSLFSAGFYFFVLPIRATTRVSKW